MYFTGNGLRSGSHLPGRLRTGRMNLKLDDDLNTKWRACCSGMLSHAQLGGLSGSPHHI